MKQLHDLVIPRVFTNWKIVARCIQYPNEEIHKIEQNNQDPYHCCADLFRDWISTDHGLHPCSWSTLLTTLKQSQQLIAAAQEIERDLTKYAYMFSLLFIYLIVIGEQTTPMFQVSQLSKGIYKMYHVDV